MKPVVLKLYEVIMQQKYLNDKVPFQDICVKLLTVQTQISHLASMQISNLNECIKKKKFSKMHD